MLFKFSSTIPLMIVSALQLNSIVTGDTIFSFKKWINYFIFPQPLCLFLPSFHFKVWLLMRTALKLLFSPPFDCSRTESWKIYELVSYVCHLGIILLIPLTASSLLFSLIILHLFPNSDCGIHPTWLWRTAV